MEQELESDLAEVHRLIPLTNSPLVRDRLHTLLDELLQIKRNMLGGASDGHALPQKPTAGGPLPLPNSALHASGSAGALAVNDLVDGFGRNVSLSSTNSLQPGQGGSVQAVEPNPMNRARSVADTGDTHSTNSAGAIEPIMSSSMLLANSHQQHMGLGTFDPIWQPGKVAPSRSEPQVIDGLLTAQQLWAQAEAAGISYDSLTNGQADLGAGLSKSQHLQGGGASGGSSSAPMHLRLGSMGPAGRQTLPPPHTQHSALGVTGANAAQWMQPQHAQIHHHHQQQQQQQGFPTVTAPAPYGRGGLPSNHQQTQSPYGPPKQQMLHNMPGGFGGSGYAARMDHSRAMRGAGAGFGGSISSGGNGGLYGSNFQLPYNSAFPGAVHPSLQYGVDLRGGELDSMGMPLFRPLTTYSWEQSDGLVKIYVPLRGVQTELLRATFTLKSLEVRVVALQGKNYVYAVKSLFMPINVDGCHVAASKTKKNVLITLQKLRSDTPEEKHWHDLTSP